jgi:segregation and condensation protein A
MPFTLDINVYSGPMDLLLHVVRQNRVDMLELPLAEIAQGFLHYARSNSELDLDEAGEVLYTASLLIRMKVRFLLPTEDEAEADDPIRDLERDEELEEMFLGIVAAARELAHNETRQRMHFARGPAAGQVDVDETEALLQDLNVQHLAEAFRQVERKLERIPARQLALFKVTVEQQAEMILSGLKEKKTISFTQVVESLTERIEVVVTFLAMLDLLRLGRIRLRQKELFGEILIQRGPKYNGTTIREAEVDSDD